jgi:hypothetical protein
MPVNLAQANNLVVERAKMLVGELVERRKNENPPFLPDEFAPLLGITDIREADLGKTSALLVRLNDGYRIVVNKNHPIVRRTFSCAHEIGHILLGELKLENYIQSVEYRTFDPQGEKKARSRVRERLCDIIATELLMPSTIFQKCLLNLGLSIDSVERLANIFRVSVQAASIRIAEVSTDPCVALLWQPSRKIRSRSLELVWSVGPGIIWQSKTRFVPVHPTARFPSVLHDAFEKGIATKGHKSFRCGTDTMRLIMESKGFGNEKNRYVLSLAFAKS